MRSMRSSAEQDRLQFEDIARLLLHHSPHLVTELHHLCTGSISLVDDKAAVLLADLCITDSSALQTALVDQQGCIAACRTLERTAGTRILQRLLGLSLDKKLFHSGMDRRLVTLLKLQRNSENDSIIFRKML